MTDTKTTFEKISSIVLNAKGDDYPDKVKLDFYKYYKQATVGDCNIPKPWFYSQLAVVKWDAWESVKGMSSEKAMEYYINLYNELQ